MGPRIQDVDADELHAVSELVVGGHETGHLVVAGRAPLAPEVDHHGSALQLRQQPLEGLGIHRGKGVGELRQQGSFGGIAGGDVPTGALGSGAAGA